MARLNSVQKDARALRDLYSTRYGLTVWGFVWRITFIVTWLAWVIIRLVMGIPPTWLTPLFAIAFTVMCREVWDGIRRRRFERWQHEQVIKTNRRKNEREQAKREC